MTAIFESIKQARAVSTPLIAVTTPDQQATQTAIMLGFNGKQPPMISWDVIRGLKPINVEGDEILHKPGVLPEGMAPEDALSPSGALVIASRFWPGTLLFFLNAQLFLDDNPPVIQAISNLRDDYKSNRRTLVMLATHITLPPELVQDVLVLDEPLPGEDQIKEIVSRVYGDAKRNLPDLPDMTPEIELASVSALAGLAEFPADQTCAMAIDVANSTIHIPKMWERKRSMINQTSGIQMLDDATLPTFADIGGLEAAKRFGSALFNGACPPRVVVWIDEIEKMFAGLGSGGVGDSSGVSQDQLGVMLREQEFNDWAGMILVGPPGAAKSHYARSTGRTHGVPTVMLDLGAMKGSLVGQSEQQIRAALKVIKAVAGKGGAFFIATCNDLTVLPPELRRRYKYGIWFFDLPDKAERDLIWKICLAKFGLDGKRTKHTFDDSGWTGAEIRNACELAWRLNQSLDDAAKNIVPVSVSDGDRIARLRNLAHDKFLSASTPGVFRANRVPLPQPAPSGRSFNSN
jgi:hypothetical protein